MDNRKTAISSLPFSLRRRGRGMRCISTVFVFTIIFVLPHLLPAQTLITVKQDGSGDFTQIQQAVNAAIDGDTVLVWPGTYVENIVFNHKGITLASLHFTTNDSSYIDQTIIDGNQTNSCLYYDTVPNPSFLQGFTITNGQGNINTSRDPGGGIWVKSSNLEISYCKIIHNKAGNGGGIYISASEVSIFNSLIAHNSVNQQGGGLYISGPGLSLSGTTIAYNHAFMHGGGISYGGNIEYDSVNLCSIYCNYGCPGSDIARNSLGEQQFIKLDTFTVDQPDSYHLYSYLFYDTPIYPTDIIVNSQHSKTASVNANLYVNPLGDNNNSGLTPDEPLQHLAFAMAKIVSDSMNPNTIHLAEGTYSPSMGEMYPMSMRSYIDIKGCGPDSTILDAEHTTTHFDVNKYYRSFGIHNLKILQSFGNYHGSYDHFPAGIAFLNGDNISISNVHFKESISNVSGACAMGRSHQISIDRCVFKNNHCAYPLIVSAYYYYEDTVLFKTDTVKISNCIFTENKRPNNDPDQYGGGGASVNGTITFNDSLNVYFTNCAFTENEHYSLWPQYAWSAMGAGNSAKVTAINCTFTGNHSDNSNVKAMGVVTDAEISLYNCILYNNPPGSMYMYSYDQDPWDTCKLNVSHSLFEGGPEGIVLIGYKNLVNYDASNIDTDPLFYGQGDYPYSLSAGSPCIDVGTLDLPPGIELPETDLAGNPRVHNGYVDMGAYEYGPWVGIQQPAASSQQPAANLLKIWPNPFRFETTISYERPESGQCIIRIYDLNGRCVKTLMNSQGLSGNGEMKWRGIDDSGNPVPAGTYIVAIILNGKEWDAVKLVKK